MFLFALPFFAMACSQQEQAHKSPHTLTQEGLSQLVLLDAGPCPNGMVFVSGDYCPNVEQECLKWLPGANPAIGPLRCLEFRKPTQCLSASRIPKRFCIDTFEWPNIEGQKPVIDVTWYQAKQSCESVGKRLCKETEWTFTCEGTEMKPYPYGDGYHRNEETCDQNHESMDINTPREDWSRHNFSHPAGVMKACSSPFGAFDMVANVDEWVVNERKGPYVSGLKGGYWTYRVRTRCRPMTDAHGPTFSFYQIGFRCCKDAR